MIDDEADFGNIIDAPTEEQTAAKFRPKARGKLRKTSLPSKPAPHASVKSTDESVGIVNKDNVSQEHSIHQESASLTCHGCERVGDEEHNNGLSHVATHKESMVISDTQAPATCTIGKTIDDLADFEGDTEKDSHRKGLDDDLCQEHRDKDAITVSDTWPPQDVYATVDLDSHAEMTDPHPDGSWPITGEPSVKATVKFQPYVRRNKGKGKSVSFVPPNVSDAIAPTDTNSEISNFSHLCEDIATGENLNNSPLQAAKKVFPTEAHPDDHEYNDAENQYHEVEPLDHVVDQQPKMDIRETGTSMKLRSREKLQNVGIPEHTADDNMDEDFVEPSSAKQDNDSGDEYTARGKQKVRRKPREKNVNKESSRGTKRTSRNSSTEESLKEKNQKLKSKASSAGQKRASKDSSAEQSEKKLTHRIRQKRMQEVKTLLETPEHEIDRMKLSVTHLRLLQEARERIKGKEIPSGPSSNHSFQFEEMDDGYNEQENFDDDRTENHVLENATKLNYHSYMNKQTRAKWSKSDTDLFYQGLRQFGSDFAMIQHLFPDKTRNQVRQKFKSEEKKHPMQVHDAIMHRSRDNLYFKKVIKQLNIEDVRPDINNIHEQEGASNEGDPGNKNMLGDFINDEEDNGSNWSDKEQGMHRSEVEEKKNVSTSVDDDLGDVFDWY